jgi:hypothetical protein
MQQLTIPGFYQGGKSIPDEKENPQKEVRQVTVILSDDIEHGSLQFYFCYNGHGTFPDAFSVVMEIFGTRQEIGLFPLFFEPVTEVAFFKIKENISVKSSRCIKTVCTEEHKTPIDIVNF